MEAIKSNVQSVFNRDHKAGHGKTTLITGGSGFVAAHVIDSFLLRGYNVRKTVRNEKKIEDVKRVHSKHLDQLSFAIVTDVQDPGVHDEAVKDVDGYPRSQPFVMNVEDNVRDLLDSAIKGTTSVFTSIQAHNPTVKRVVITSSFASIVDVNPGAWPGYIYSEKDWNPVTYEEAAKKETEGGVAYCASKTFTEKPDYEFVEKKKPNFTVSSIGPPMVYGPPFHGSVTDLERLNTLSADIYRLMNGSEKTVPENPFFAFVDVRDVGEAHLKAYESAEAAGQRYFTTAGVFTYQQICDIIIRTSLSRGTEYQRRTLGGGKFPNVYVVDNSKAKALGFTFRDLQT